MTPKQVALRLCRMSAVSGTDPGDFSGFYGEKCGCTCELGPSVCLCQHPHAYRSSLLSVDEHQDQDQLVEERVYFIFSTGRLGSQGQN